MSVLRVLHVDDEPDIREVVLISLGLDPDVVTRSCSSGLEALSAAEDWSPDVILLDVMMPGMDGPATLARLRANARTARIPVVFMTARAQSRELDMFRSLGAAGVIAKPFDPMTLAASLRAVLRPADPRLNALRKVFLQRLVADTDELAGHRSALDSDTSSPAELARIRDIAHALAGAGAIFGHSDVGDAAAALEEAAIVRINASGSLEGVTRALDRVVACVERSSAAQMAPSRLPGADSVARRGAGVPTPSMTLQSARYSVTG
jgi:CheY-like chemotaxis protein